METKPAKPASPLTPKQRLDNRLLRLSIKHWKRLRDGREQWDEGPFADSCPLCQRYRVNTPYGYCFGCPVKDHTGVKNCHRTPYYAAREAYFKRSENLELARLAAQAEIDFLRSLIVRPERAASKPGGVK